MQGLQVDPIFAGKNIPVCIGPFARPYRQHGGQIVEEYPEEPARQDYSMGNSK